MRKVCFILNSIWSRWSCPQVCEGDKNNLAPGLWGMEVDGSVLVSGLFGSLSLPGNHLFSMFTFLKFSPNSLIFLFIPQNKKFHSEAKTIITLTQPLHARNNHALASLSFYKLKDFQFCNQWRGSRSLCLHSPPVYAVLSHSRVSGMWNTLQVMVIMMTKFKHVKGCLFMETERTHLNVNGWVTHGHMGG